MMMIDDNNNLLMMYKSIITTTDNNITYIIPNKITYNPPRGRRKQDATTP